MKYISLYPTRKKCPVCGYGKNQYYTEKGVVGGDINSIKYVTYDCYICGNPMCKHRWEGAKETKIEPIKTEVTLKQNIGINYH